MKELYLAAMRGISHLNFFHLNSGTSELRPLKGLSSAARNSQVVSIARLAFTCRPIYVHPVLICNVMTIQICTVLIKQIIGHTHVAKRRKAITILHRNLAAHKCEDERDIRTKNNRQWVTASTCSDS